MQTRKVVYDTLLKAGVGTPMSKDAIVKSSGLRKAVVGPALYRLGEFGVVTTRENGEETLYLLTGKPDTKPYKNSPSEASLRRDRKPDTRGVELVFRVLDSKGGLIELSLAQAVEIERQLEAMRRSLGQKLGVA